MSSALAIATVTEILRRIIDNETDGVKVVTLPPDKLRDETGNAINLFLYHTTINAAWSNMPLPDRVKPGEQGQLPLPLNLYYLLTVYSGNDPTHYRLLGQAMRILHDHPLLTDRDIIGIDPDSNLHRQIERVRITPQTLSLDEMSKLWTTFQTPYRPSVAYQVAVVLIESDRPSRAAPPVLTRGRDDSGITSRPDLAAPFPLLTDLSITAKDNNDKFLRGKNTGARLGDILTLTGVQLSGDNIQTTQAVFRHPLLEDPILQPLTSASATEATVELPTGPTTVDEWPAGIYTVSLLIERQEQGQLIRRFTNELAFGLTPQMITPLPAGFLRIPMTDFPNQFEATVDLQCSPKVKLGQRVSLLLGHRDVRAEAVKQVTDLLSFKVEHLLPEETELMARLRVDGADSLIVQRNDPDQPDRLSFDQEQKIRFHD